MEFVKQLDISLFWFINSHYNQFLDIFFGIITNLGNGWIITPLLLGLTAWKMPRQFWLQTVLCGVIALALGGLVNNGIKKTVDRPRPLLYFETVCDSSSNSAHCAVPEDADLKRVHAPGQALRLHSFPSGHTNTAFGAALFCALIFGGWFWSSFLAALLVAYSRVYLGVHFPLDTLAGALLGLITTGAICLIFFRQKWLPLREGFLKRVCNYWS